MKNVYFYENWTTKSNKTIKEKKSVLSFKTSSSVIALRNPLMMHEEGGCVKTLPHPFWNFLVACFFLATRWSKLIQVQFLSQFASPLVSSLFRLLLAVWLDFRWSTFSAFSPLEVTFPLIRETLAFPSDTSQALFGLFSSTWSVFPSHRTVLRLLWLHSSMRTWSLQALSQPCTTFCASKTKKIGKIWIEFWRENLIKYVKETSNTK